MMLKDKNIIVTGGANGIGLSLTKKLLQGAAKVFVLDVDEEAIRKLDQTHLDVQGYPCDITNKSEVKEAINKIFEETGKIDVLVNNAGIIVNAPLIKCTEGKLETHSLELWDKVIAANLSGLFYVTAAVLDKMVANRTKGVVINISSICSSGNAGQAAYSAAKAGVNALTVSLAKELGLFGIRIAAIAPGFTATTNSLKSMSETIIQDWKRKTPLRRMADPEEIADAVLFVIQNDFFNGRVLEVDGGLRI